MFSGLIAMLKQLTLFECCSIKEKGLKLNIGQMRKMVRILIATQILQENTTFVDNDNPTIVQLQSLLMITAILLFHWMVIVIPVRRTVHNHNEISLWHSRPVSRAYP